MKIVFCSNYMNHHQLYVSKALISLGVEYTFVATTDIPTERKALGYKDMNSAYDWIVRAYESKEQEKVAKKLIKEADLVIAGSAPMQYLRGRILKNKPVFLYSERWFKSADGDVSKFKTLHNWLSNLLHRKYFNYFNVYMLCAGAYTAHDCNVYGNFTGKCYKWGYFPYVEKYDIAKLMEQKGQNEKVKLLWVGRFLDWKHPEYPIEAARRLKEKGVKFELNMIGVGEEYANIGNAIMESKLEDCVHLLGSMPTEKVREYMEKSNIFLFTSDFNEGWGAVLNESMNSACAVVANHGIGAAPFLIQDKSNGILYNNGDIEEFCNAVEQLVSDKNMCEKMGKAAYNTIVEEWNPDNAAQKLLKLYNILFENSGETIENGVCSKAEILGKNWR